MVWTGFFCSPVWIPDLGPDSEKPHFSFKPWKHQNLSVKPVLKLLVVFTVLLFSVRRVCFHLAKGNLKRKLEVFEFTASRLKFTLQLHQTPLPEIVILFSENSL